jgi:hypothetical protein
MSSLKSEARRSVPHPVESLKVSTPSPKCVGDYLGSNSQRRHEIHHGVGIGKMWCIRYKHHRAVANIAKPSLRRCQYREAFIVLLPTENNTIPGFKFPLRH